MTSEKENGGKRVSGYKRKRRLPWGRPNRRQKGEVDAKSPPPPKQKLQPKGG